MLLFNKNSFAVDFEIINYKLYQLIHMFNQAPI